MSLSNPPSLAAATMRHLRELGGDDLLLRLVTLLLELTPQRLSALAGALESGDLLAARHAAHALCSTAGTLGAASLLDAAQEVETAGGLPATRAAAGNLQAEWSRLREPLVEWLEDAATPGGRERTE
jgi:HPt (histidine-containing phosphotransfer) domain-containing protein